MESKEFTILRIYELIEENRAKSQRNISETLNISLGKVNTLIKQLMTTGCIQIKEDMHNRNQYVITKKGSTEKIRLRYSYLYFSLSHCCDLHSKLLRKFDEMCARDIHSIVFYGTGDLAELAFKLLQHTHIRLIAAVDSKNPEKMFFNVPIMAPGKLASLNFDKILVTELADGKTIENIASELDISEKNMVTI